MRQWFVVVAVAAIILVGGLWARAQVQPPAVPAPTIVSGADVGFRVDRWEGDTPIGRWVIRKDGKWVEPRSTMGPRRLTSR